MNPADIASFFSGDWSWILVAIVAGGLPIAISVGVRKLRRISGPVDCGVAQVLSLRQFGSVAVNGPMRMICRIRLRVDARDREDYDVTVWKNIAPWDLGAVQPGNSVAVEISATNPKKVRIGSNSATHRSSVITTRSFHNGPMTFRSNDATTPQSTEAPSAVSNPHDIAEMFRKMGASVDPVALENLLEGAVSPAPVVSAADILATGQRVPAVLKSFAPTGTTPRSLGRTPSRPEGADAPHYLFEVELRFPHLAPMTGRAIQVVPVDLVPKLAIGLELSCVADPADPSRRFVVDWAQV